MSEARAKTTLHPDVLTAASERSTVAELGGGKGTGLFDLTTMGVPVPRWGIVSTRVLRSFRRAAGLDEVIEEGLGHLGDAPGDELIRVAAGRIASAFAAAAVTPEAEAAVAAAYAQAGEGAVAVRSSALGEDSARFSFAGQHTTVLNLVGLEAVIDGMRACWASAWSAEALRYRLMNGLPLEGIEMAVVVQRIVPAERSGVLFSVNPANGSADEMVISASYGLGESVVSGAVDADTIVLARETGAVLDETVGAKEQLVEPLPGGGCRTRPVAAADRSEPALSRADLAALHHEAIRLERLVGGPQDIEWAIVEGAVWILQSRPITSLPAAGGGELRLWDNSNIIESYGEIVAPLTYTFARHVYAGVYRQHCELLGVPKRRLAEMEPSFSQLLGYFDGRVYYNLLNWYRMIRLIPFYAVNRRVLEIAMGTESLAEKTALEQRPFVVDSRVEAALLKARLGVRFFWHFATIHRLVRDFRDHFYSVYDEFDALDYSGREGPELYSMFLEMERRLMVRWGRMTMLETSIGLSFGALYGLVQRWLPAAPEWFLFEAVKASPDVESMQPVRRLEEIARHVVADPSLRERVLSLPVDRLDEALRLAPDPPARALIAQLDSYLAEFGYRHANELKLEEPDLREDPAALFTLLKSAVGTVEAGETGETGGRADADEYLSAHLRGWRRWVFERVRRRVQRCLADRESVRFCRTRIFGLSRRMFRAVGEAMVRMDAIDAPADVFYLRLEELRGCFEGTVAHREIKPLVALRKEEERRNRERDLPPRFMTREGVYWGALDRACEEAKAAGPVDGPLLKGTPCSPGVVCGEAKVVDRPEDVEGGVLVTYRTDPGWVSVLSSASALLIERGSPLTHVAVVARELGIPTIVQIPGLTKRVRTGMGVRVDGGTGSIELAADGEEAE